jgi:hypothetical protein
MAIGSDSPALRIDYTHNHPDVFLVFPDAFVKILRISSSDGKTLWVPAKVVATVAKIHGATVISTVALRKFRIINALFVH